MIDILKVTAFMFAATFGVMVLLSYPTIVGGILTLALIGGMIARRARRLRVNRSLQATLTSVSNALAQNAHHIRRFVWRV